MTIEDIKAYKENAIAILERESQYATAKATKQAFDLLIWIETTKAKLWEDFEYKTI